MLKQSEKFEDKFKTNLVTNSLLELGDDISDEAKGKGRKFVSRFIEAGVAHYRDFGDVLITKETLDKFINTMVGCPVIITHKDIDDNNADKERVGVVSEVWYNSADGWYYCSGIIWDKKAIDLVKNQGWSVSCTYDFESDNQAKTHNGKKIDREFTNGEFLHLALVDNPRYERANIVMNSLDCGIVYNWVEPENIDYWFKTKTGVSIPVAKNQTKEQALKTFIDSAKKRKEKVDKKRDEAYSIISIASGKDKSYLKRNLKKQKVYEEVAKIIETSDNISAGDNLNFDYYGYNTANMDIEYVQNMVSQAFADIMSNNFNTYTPEEEKQLELYKENKEFQKQYNKLIDDVNEGNVEFDKITEPLAKILGVSSDDLDEKDFENFWTKFEKRTANNNVERKENIIMTALNDLENFVRGIVENACKKEVENEKDDKRKLIDEVAGMMKSAGADDELIRTAISKMEKIAYEKSEADTADNNCKNEKEEVKEEMKEEKEADKAEPLEEKEEEKDEKEDEFKEEKEIVKNSSDENDTSAIDKTKEIVYNSNSTVKSSYVTRDERLKLGDNY